MKKLILVACILMGIVRVNAQATQPTDVVQPPYLRFPTVPPFKILAVDSTTWITKDDLKKNRLTLIMFFSPECDHCKHQTQDMLAQFDKFKDIEIVMATYQPFDEMRTFYNYYRIADHPNIRMGRDEKYMLPPYYKMQSLPYLALYDKKGNYITHFEGNQKVETIMNAFNKGKD
ncbi:MAG TPA: thioredoxin-like domain-containing protein [Puia sp.]|nr:thioredoxin-like domain-containing protein [Puia sp.]